MIRAARPARGCARTLLCPVFLLHGRGMADGLVGLTGLAFLLRSALARDWSWLRTGWVRIARSGGCGWWCALPAARRWRPGSFVQALVVVRFLVFAAALEHWVLARPEARRWLAWLVSAAALYIALQSLLQFATGRNLYGYPRGPTAS